MPNSERSTPSLAVLNDPRLAKLAALGVIAQTATGTVNSWARKFKGAAATTVTIQDDPSNRLLYGAVLADLNKRTPRRRNIIATAHRRDGSEWEMIPWLDPESASFMMVEGYPVHVSSKDRSKKGEHEGFANYEARDIVITCLTLESRDKVLAWIADVVTNLNEETKPGLYYPDRWGGWSRSGDLPERDLDSVVLPAGVLDELVEDLDTFLGAESVYARTGTPWHRGYLFAGLPGTGKTSTALALAHRFGLAVHLLPAGSLPKDASLDALVADIPPRSILLVEDVDAASGARSRDESQKDVASTAGILNVLDGVTTPKGMIAILTTNRPDVLDGALVRSGRVNKRVDMGEITPDQAADLVEWLTGVRPVEPLVLEEGTVAADIVSRVLPELVS